MKLRIILSFIALTLGLRAFVQNNSMIDSLVNVVKTAKEDTVKVNNFISLSKHYITISNAEKTIQYADSAIVLAGKLNFKKGEAHAFNNMGNGYYMQGKYPESLKYYLTSLKICKEIGDMKGIAYAYISTGNVYAYQGNYPEALKNYFASLKINEEIGNKEGIASSYANLGIIYEKLGDYPEALKNQTSARKIFEEIGQKESVGLSFNNIGVIYVYQGNYPEALKNYLASLKICEEIGNKAGIGLSYINIGVIYEIQGNYPEGLKNYLAALKINEEIGDETGIASAYINLGEVNYHLSKFQDARKYSDDALSLSKKIGNKWDIKDSYEGLSKLDSAEGNFSLALKHYKLYTLYKDSLLNEESNNQTAQMKIQFETEKKDKEIELLNKDNEIKSLQLKQQQLSLVASWLEDEKNQNKMLLMNNSIEIQQLSLAKTQKELEHQQAEAKVKASEFQLISKEKELKEQQLGNQKLLRNGMLVGIVLLALLGLLFFRGFRLRKKLERQQAIIRERKRISADLHDDIGSGLSRISLLSELVKSKAKTPEAKQEADKIAAVSLELSSKISEIIWALNSNNDYLENLVAYIRRYAAEYFENSAVKLKIITPENIARSPISGACRRDIFYSVKEALHNIIKHAQANEAELQFTINKDVLSVIISDNGKGMPQGEMNRFGSGVNNMRNRMKSINGDFSIENHQGTKIILTLPV